MLEFMQGGNEQLDLAHKAIQENEPSMNVNDVKLLSPITNPPSVRDAYAFRQHVATARRNRGVDMIPEFDQFPIFYFTNHNAILGPTDDILCMPDHMQKLDFELEAAIVIGKKGRNIKAKDADDYIAGYLIMNDIVIFHFYMILIKLKSFYHYRYHPLHLM